MTSRAPTDTTVFGDMTVEQRAHAPGFDARSPIGPVRPTRPRDYHQAKTAGWTYHSNGASGRPFWATVQNGVLHLDLDTSTTRTERFTEPFDVRLDLLERLLHIPPTSEPVPFPGINTTSHCTYVTSARDGDTIITVLDSIEVYNGKPGRNRRFIVFQRPGNNTYPTTAVTFELAALLAGDTTGTMRGDKFARYADTLRTTHQH